MNPLGLRAALRAGAPVNDFRFLDVETVVMRRVEARRLADGTVDIDRFPARSADQMMMIVTDAILKQRGRASRLNAT